MSEKQQTEVRYFEVELGKKEDPAFRTEEYESDYSIAVKTTHYPSLVEAEKFLEKDIARLGYSGVHAIREIKEWEVHCFFDDSNFNNWKILEK